MNAEEVIDRSIKRAQDTLIYEHPGGHCVILSHPGQSKPELTPKFLRENFGIVGDYGPRIKLLSESEEHRPRTLEERALAAAGSRQKRIEELRAELARLEADDAVAGDGHPAAPAKASRSKAGVESSDPAE